MRLSWFNCLLVMTQLLSTAVVVSIQMVFWEHWGPLLPLATMLAVTTAVFFFAARHDPDILKKRLFIYGTDAISMGLAAFLTNTFWGSGGVLISFFLGFGAGVGTLICCACAGDLVLSLLGRDRDDEVPNQSHFRDWPSD